MINYFVLVNLSKRYVLNNFCLFIWWVLYSNFQVIHKVIFRTVYILWSCQICYLPVNFNVAFFISIVTYKQWEKIVKATVTEFQISSVRLNDDGDINQRLKFSDVRKKRKFQVTNKYDVHSIRNSVKFYLLQASSVTMRGTYR